jgi:hypothetical protein
MSDIDTGDYGHDYTEAHGDEQYGHELYGQEHDHHQSLDLFANQHAQEHDVHYEHGHHEAYANPHEQYESDDYTRYDEHDAEANSTFAVHADESDHDARYLEEEFFNKHFDFEHALPYEGGEREALAAN